MPGWVQRHRLVVAAAEDFLLWVFDRTGSPEALGSRVSLAWIGGLTDGQAPMTHRTVDAERDGAIAEFEVAAQISAGESYPPAQWWVDLGIQSVDVPSAGFWEAHAGYASTRSYAQGVAVALGWALGVIDDITLMTPRFYEDGSQLSDDERQRCAEVLHALSVTPLPPPPRPQLAGRPARGTASWLA
ncbi:MAG: hypothetical protein J0I49_14945 [Pseudonocardia sp.]|uniref:hypothetical protein n=1 Tax=Pseudonocardia sp. TaxID=60912 RepID=UPI001ACFC693|nr:hypothetical protein [Pseudonocardia sp.]MBN9099391.1 hypothetical protein [Pseudonocardia sp.]